MQEDQRIYRIIFTQDDKVYEVYAQYICEDNLMGFIEIEELLFDEANSVVVDPSEEKLKTEFKGVKRSYIPMHMVLRIDEMEKRGAAKIKEPARKGSNVHYFTGRRKNPVEE